MASRSDVHVRIPTEVLTWVRQQADRELRSVSAQIVSCVKRAMEAASAKAEA
jgi:hypothetical protein